MPDALVTCTAFQEVTWRDWPVCPFADELAVFRAALPDGAEWMPNLAAFLSPGEVERAERYRRPADQLRFGTTRGLLRLLLARYCRHPPIGIKFATGVNGKPELVHPAGWHVNVSHSGNWILIAIGKFRVGVDLEWENPGFAFHDVMDATFAADEQAYINACRNTRLGFYDLWTRKEALVKAMGTGLTDDVRRIPSLTGLHRVAAGLMEPGRQWTVGGFTVADGYPAAVAHEGRSLVRPAWYTLNGAFISGLDASTGDVAR